MLDKPGQALAYKVGQLKILQLRDRAKKALGEKFELRSFHDQVLDTGALPLDVLSDRIDAWIAREGCGNQVSPRFARDWKRLRLAISARSGISVRFHWNGALNSSK